MKRAHKDLLAHLEGQVRARGWEIRREVGSFIGGLCRVRDRWVVVLNRRTPPEVQLAILEQTLKRLPA
jgi:hypothetical protein|nr:MAG: hypothetical protein KatS3mg041_1560 [Bacteroidota bacterium]